VIRCRIKISSSDSTVLRSKSKVSNWSILCTYVGERYQHGTVLISGVEVGACEITVFRCRCEIQSRGNTLFRCKFKFSKWDITLFRCKRKLSEWDSNVFRCRGKFSAYVCTVYMCRVKL